MEDEASGREEVELDDEWRSRVWVPSKNELGGELMAAIVLGQIKTTVGGRMRAAR